MTTLLKVMLSLKNFFILSIIVCFAGYVRYNYRVVSRVDEIHQQEVSEKDKLFSEIEKQNQQLIEELEEEKTKNQELEGQLITCQAERQLVVEYYDN